MILVFVHVMTIGKHGNSVCARDDHWYIYRNINNSTMLQHVVATASTTVDMEKHNSPLSNLCPITTYLSCIASFLQASALRNAKQSTSLCFFSSSTNNEPLQYCTTKPRTSGNIPTKARAHVTGY